MIDPGGIPQYTGDFGKLSKAVVELRKRAVAIRNDGKNVHGRFQATAAYYKAPEADQLLSSTQPVMDTADEFAGHIESLADALDTFVAEAKPHADRLKHLREKAFAFVDSVRGDDDWTEDQDKVDAHQALMDGVAEAVAGFQEAERNAANKIGSISPAICRPGWAVDDGSHAPGMYGVDADTLKSMDELPWGSPEGRTYDRWSLDWWGHGIKSWAWDGIVKDSLWGGFLGLGTLVDNLAGVYGPEARDQTWDSLRRTLVGAYAYGMDAAGQGDHLSDWQRGSEAYAKEFGKQFVAYDMWEEDPARAHAVTTFNILTLFAGGAGAVSKLSKAGRLAETAGALARAGDLLDPIAGTARTARALSDLPKVSEVLTRVTEHLKIPKPRFPDAVLDLSDRYRIDKDGNFIPLNPDGTPNTAPAPQEPVAADHLADTPPGDRVPVGVGGRSDEHAAAQVGDGLSPEARHDVPGRHGADTARGTHGASADSHGGQAGEQREDRLGGASSHPGSGGDSPGAEHGHPENAHTPQETNGNGDTGYEGDTHGPSETHDQVPGSSETGSGGDGFSNRDRPPREGDTNYVVDNPENWADTITDIDRIEDGVLWEEKSATGRDPRVNVDKWIAKHVFKKLDSYVRARPYMNGFENAPIGISFTEPGATPEFRAAVESGIAEWRAKHPDVDVRVRWAE